MSKTPKFDSLIDKILSEIRPCEKMCIDCKLNFLIIEDDIIFYNLFRVTPPTLCQNCRRRRRLSFSNYSNIYKRKCDVSGHVDTMISLVAPVMPWVTYDYDTYYSDKWDALSFGRDVKEGDFFGQYLSILKEIPQPGVRRGPGCVNSDYSFYGQNTKNCYYTFGSWKSEDVFYSASIFVCRTIMDSYYLRDVDTAYQSVLTDNCFKCTYASFSSQCVDSDFIYDCRNCQNCFGCVNLRNKNYCWFNEQLTKEEYTKRRQGLNLGSRSVINEYKNKFLEFLKSNPVRASRIFHSENVSGNDIKESKNCYDSFQVERSENVRYGQMLVMVKDSMDVSFSGHTEKTYETQNVGSHSSNVKFSFACKEMRDSEFCMSCNNCSNCFGCVGLKNVSYAIFNKVYTEDEYWQKVDEIKTNMIKRGEYGEFFPMQFSPYPYNSSLAHIMYPMSEEEASSRGLFWQKDVEVDTSAVKTISINDLPDDTNDVDESIYDFAILGENSGKPFRLIKEEVNFYKRYNIALPYDTPYQRIIDRFRTLSNFQTYSDICVNCGIEIISAYKKSDGYKPYCEKCYQQEVI